MSLGDLGIVAEECKKDKSLTRAKLENLVGAHHRHNFQASLVPTATGRQVRRRFELLSFVVWVTGHVSLSVSKA